MVLVDPLRPLRITRIERKPWSSFLFHTYICLIKIGMGRRRVVQTELIVSIARGAAGRRGAKAGRRQGRRAPPRSTRGERRLTLSTSRCACTVPCPASECAERLGSFAPRWSGGRSQRTSGPALVDPAGPRASDRRSECGRGRLSRGMQGLKIRLAKALNRVWRRAGSVFSDRYHAHALKTPREVRNALLYVLNNFRKHHPRRRHPKRLAGSAVDRGRVRRVEGSGHGTDVLPARRPRSWLLRVGWRRGGLLDPDRVPAR
jgi:hypothetical protein